MAVERLKDGVRVEDLDAPSAPEKFIELVDGELIRRTPAGSFHNTVAYNIEKLFDDFCATRPELTFAGGNEGFLLRRNPVTMLSPDACLYRRRPKSKTTWLEFTPEVAVEVLSPSNTLPEMAFKRHCFFEAGTEQFWLVYPEQRKLEFYYQDGRTSVAEGDAVAEGEGIIAGLHIPLDLVFKER